MSRSSLLEAGTISEDYDSNGIQTHNHLVRKRTLNHLAKPAKWLSVPLWTKWLWVRISVLSRGWFVPKIVRTKHVISGSSHQTNEHFVLKLIFYQLAITNQHAFNYKTEGNYKIIALTVHCWLRLTVWLTININQYIVYNSILLNSNLRIPP